MAASQDSSPKEIQILEAPLSAVPSLTTMDARAFHPINEFHKRLFPDTPLNRAWWSRAFEDEINSPDCHVLAAIDPSAIRSTSTLASPDTSAVGILTLRLLQPSSPTVGFWTFCERTPDMDKVLFDKCIESMKDLPGVGTERFLLEFFGVDHSYKGTGVGRRLMEKACEIADEKGVSIVVEANHMAEQFYRKFGFGFVNGQESLKVDGEEYWHFLFVRPPKVKK